MSDQVINPLAANRHFHNGIQSWIDSNNDLIYNLITCDTETLGGIDINTRMKLVQQLKLRNKELRMLRINRMTDKLLDKIEVAISNLMMTDIDGDIQFLPMYLQILKALQDSAAATNTEVDSSDALIFDTIEAVTKTGLSESSRDRIKAAAKELLVQCTTISKDSEST